MTGMMPTMKTPPENEPLTENFGRMEIDLRLVKALAGDRTLSAREEDTLARLVSERGEGLYGDVLYALTQRHFPSRQARSLWNEIRTHREELKQTLGRDVGIALASHDYLSNVVHLLKEVTVIEEKKLASIADVATHDGLTDLLDQTAFKRRLREELERQARYGGPISLVMFDLDRFKELNDTQGHHEGDEALIQISDLLRRQVRSMDTAARYGGDEFAVILPQVESGAAYIFAERLRQNVAHHFEDKAVAITISVGIATNSENENSSAEELIERADTQLYRSKKGGRNRVSQETVSL